MIKQLRMKTMLLLCALIIGSVSSAWGDDYEKITDASGLVAGEKYLLVYENGNSSKALGSISTTKTTYGLGVGVSVSDNKITISTEEVAVLTLEGTTGAWKFKSSINNKYLAWISGNSLTTNDSGTEWAITYTSSVADITTDSGNRHLKWNSGSPRFACYTSEQTAVALYKKQTVVNVSSVSLDNTAVSLEVGQNQTLTATVSPANATNKNVIWSSSAPAIADVEDGVISAKAEGTATITVTTEDGSKTATCDVTVTPSTSPTAILSETDLDFGTIAIGTTPSLSFTITPSNLTGALTISCDNAKYTVTPTSIASNVTTETTITVIANPTAKNDDMDGTITISGGGLASNKEVTLTANPYDPNQVDFDFSFDKIGTDGWSNSYEKHSVIFPEATVTFSKASKQTSTITTIPVQKAGDVVIILNRVGDTMSSAEFTCTQWTTKEQTIQLYYSTDGGETWTQTGSDETDFSIEANNLPDGTNAVKLTSTNSNQIGIASASIILKPATKESVSVTPAGYATYVGDHDLNFLGVSGLKAYRAEVSGSEVHFYEVEQVPAGEGVLLKGAAGNYEVPTMTGAASIINDFIRGTGETVASETDGKHNYILNNVDGVVGFYQAANNVVETNHAYLQTTGVASARLSMIFDDEAETTGISDIKAVSPNTNNVYNLRGQRVAQPVKGLYIVNGKKIIIK